MPQTDSAVIFKNGQRMSNRFMLAPLTNGQSHDDGKLSDEEYHWLTMRAEGGFGLTMTCASHVQFIGKGFAGQLGIYDDAHIDGHKRLAAAIKANDSLAIIQLHHAGMRSPEDEIHEQPVSASDIEKHNARALSLPEVQQLRDDFIAAARRAQISGYDGIEVHGAHGYILSQFISAEINKRNDQYGGDLQNRARLLFEIIDGIRVACGADFLLGVRLSPERFGMQLSEMKTLCQQLVDEHDIDFIDLSLWDVFKQTEEVQYQSKSLLEHFTEIDYKDVKLTVAGKINSGKDVQAILDAGVDFVTIGRAAILHHDFPKLVISNPDFEPVKLPVSEAYLAQEGLSEKFITYMKNWDGFVASPFHYETTYTLDKSHFSETFDESMTQNRTGKAYFKSIGLALAGFAILLFTDFSPYVAWFLVAIGGVDALGIYYRKPWWLARQMVSQAANNKLSLSIDENGVMSKSFAVESRLAWSEIERIERTKQGWLLYYPAGRSYLSARCLSEEANKFVSEQAALKLKQ